jgi:NADH-quinone oxidoreductase subunit G
MINNEGRAQRFYQVFVPSNNYIKESWKWIGQMKALQTQAGNGQQHHPDELLAKLETAMPQFKGIAQVAPQHDFRVHGQLIPREPHRFSGRTAIMASINVSEPKPLKDDDSPLTFTMEGYKGIPPGPVVPFFWSPGWNSVQSVTKYQEEVGGPLRGGNSGVRLFKEKTGTAPSFFKDIPEAFAVRKEKWLLLPAFHVFGSGELSMYTKALEELSPEPYVALSKYDMDQLGIAEGSAVEIVADERKYSLPVKMKNELGKGIALVSTGLRGRETMNWGSWVKINLKM